MAVLKQPTRLAVVPLISIHKLQLKTVVGRRQSSQLVKSRLNSHLPPVGKPLKSPLRLSQLPPQTLPPLTTTKTPLL